jgi:O-antigen/teichoic acid export membrane protein
MSCSDTAAEQVVEAPASLAVKPEVQAAVSGMRANFLWVMAGNVVYLGSQWLLVMEIARLGTPVMVGQLALAFAWTAPIFLFSHLRLRSVQATDAGDEFQPGDYMMLRIVTTIAAMAVATALALFYVRESPATAAVVIAVALAKAFESGSDILYGLFQKWEEMRLTANSMIARGVVSVLSVGAVMFYLHDIVAASVALAVSSMVPFVAFDAPAAYSLAKSRRIERFGLQWNRGAMWRLAKSALPLGQSALLMSWGVNVPRYFVEHYSGTRELGLFSAIWYVAFASGYVVSALGEAISPRMSRSYNIGQDDVVKRQLMTSIAAAIGIGSAVAAYCAVWGRETLTALYGAEYASGHSLLVWLCTAAIVANVVSVVNYGMIAVRRFHAHLISLAIMLIITAALCTVFTPLYGVIGAAWALIVAYAVQAVYGLVWMFRPVHSRSPEALSECIR